VKKSNMDKGALKDFIYGGITELMRNRHYYYYSPVGATYCRWTEEGEKAVAEYMHLVGCKMLEVEEAELNQRAKDIVLKNLTGENT
jgi:hypothetical protein